LSKESSTRGQRINVLKENKKEVTVVEEQAVRSNSPGSSYMPKKSPGLYILGNETESDRADL
jgi:hypothetical protein